MSIFLKLFLEFLKIGAVSFGGGYGMISVMREVCLVNGWLSETELLDFIAIAESTPGPIAVNMATFIGSSQAGLLGAFLATLGVVLPAFIILLIISAALKNILKYAGVKATLSGVRPVVVGLIFATAFTMLFSLVFGSAKLGGQFTFNLKECVLFLVLLAILILWRKIFKKSISPIVLILISGALGMILYSL